MPEVNTGNATSTLRRSCRYCRGRKIRCSGSLKCTACQERGLDCVYDVETGKGRPRIRKRNNSSLKDAQPFAAISSAIDLSPQQERSLPPLSKGVNINSTLETPKEPTIAAKLGQMFDENFVSLPKENSNVFQKIIADFQRKVVEDSKKAIEATGCDFEDLDKRNTITYDTLLSAMSAEMIEIIASRFGSLGCQLREPEGKRFYLSGLIRDQTNTMFGSPYDGPNPVLDYHNHRIFQLIDTWFGVHPLSAIVSKSLLLTSLKANSVDHALLAIILADASSAHGASHITNTTEEAELVLLQFAETQLRQRSADDLKISTAQALALLGWRKLCLSQVRRATCYLGYAGRVVTELNRLSKLPGNVNHQRINGIEIGAVENEVIRNIYWTVFSTTFWALMQLGAPLSHMLPKSLPVEFPPINESSSVAISLDLASDNISTLLPQSRSLRGLWPLSQIACTTVHICALDPNDHDVGDNQVSNTWQSRHLHQLRRLLKFHSEVSSICTKVTQILREAIRNVENEVQDEFSQAVVLCSYWTLIIQLFWPKGTGDDGKAVITPALMQNFCKSLTQVCQVIASISNTVLGSGVLGVDLSRTKTIAETLVCCLDACGRALNRIHDRAFSGSNAEFNTVSENKATLADFASKLHEESKGALARTVSCNQPVKRRLKTARNAFSAFAQDSSHNDSEFQGTLSMAQSETASLVGGAGTGSISENLDEQVIVGNFNVQQSAPPSCASLSTCSNDNPPTDLQLGQAPLHLSSMADMYAGSTSEGLQTPVTMPDQLRTMYHPADPKMPMIWEQLMDIQDTKTFGQTFDDYAFGKPIPPMLDFSALAQHSGTNPPMVTGSSNEGEMQFW